MTCDESLYRQYLSGDDEGLNALMKKYGDPLTLYIDGYLHDVHEAEELMLDVFAYLFTKKPKIRDGGFKAYLYKAARHMALRHKRKRKPLFSLDALTDEPDGTLTVRFTASGWLEMAWHLYKWGDAVEVIEPAALRELVAGFQNSGIKVLP